MDGWNTAGALSMKLYSPVLRTLASRYDSTVALLNFTLCINLYIGAGCVKGPRDIGFGGERRLSELFTTFGGAKQVVSGIGESRRNAKVDRLMEIVEFCRNSIFV